MTYQALARKWRPRTFADVVGQSHVVSAMTHALDHDRVHHAFLFTGTRGVGKTTLARLLAKSLNCEQGVSSTPCGECGACQSVEQGRFVDLLEIDAASRTRVDDTREILDNVQYAPTVGRYKVYLIDEVHMLSTHSFNALLKTLEEPPPHVKFLLATTDPQKLPPTILSRCLQFNLRALRVPEISGQLAAILNAEDIEPENEALELLARSADGSMRDALSLLDQAIAFSGARLDGEAVRSMLGMIEGNQVVDLVAKLVDADTAGAFAIIDLMRERSVDFSRALDDLLILLHELALCQQAPELMKERDSPWHGQLELAERMAPEQVQLFYQIALLGKRDLALAPDPARGFEMTILRMLAFEPKAPEAHSKPSTLPPAKRKVVGSSAPKAGDTPVMEKSATVTRIRDAQAHTEEDSRDEVGQARAARTAGPVDPSAWGLFAESESLTGLVKEFAMNLEFQRADGDIVHLRLQRSLAHLTNRGRSETLARLAEKHFGQPLKLRIEMHDDTGEAETPSVQRNRRLQAERDAAEAGFLNDPEISNLIDQFDAELVPDSVRPAKQRGE